MDNDQGQFLGTFRTISGEVVPTGYGYLVLPTQCTKEGHTIRRRHPMLLQGDWQVMDVTDDYFELRVYGQLVNCNTCVNMLENETLIDESDNFICRNNQSDLQMATFFVKMLRPEFIQQKYTNIILPD